MRWKGLAGHASQLQLVDEWCVVELLNEVEQSSDECLLMKEECYVGCDIFGADNFMFRQQAGSISAPCFFVSYTFDC